MLAAAEHLPETRAVATIGAPAGTEHLLHLLGESRAEIEETGEAEVCLASRPFRVRKQFLDDVTSQPQAERIQRLDVPLLVMHSPMDDTVGVENAREIFDAAHHPKSFVSLDGADHLLTRAADARFAASVLAAWASRYLDDATRPPTSDERGRSGGRGGRGRGVRERPRPVRAAHHGRAARAQRRRAGAGRARHRPLAVRSAARRPRRVHLDDAAHVRRAQAVAPGERERLVASLPDPRQGLRGLRDPVRPARPHRAHDPADG